MHHCSSQRLATISYHRQVLAFALRTLMIFLLALHASAAQPAPPESPSASPALQGKIPAIEADYLLILRVPASGATDCLFVRYHVSSKTIRVSVLAEQPQFNVRFFPIRATGLTAFTNGQQAWMRQVSSGYECSLTAGEAEKIPFLVGGNAAYDPRESCAAVLQFQSLTHRQHPREVASTTSPLHNPSSDNRITRDPAGRAESMVDVAATDQILRKTNWIYSADGQPAAINVHDFPRIIHVPSTAMISASASEDSLEKQSATHSERPTVLPCLYHSGGRRVHVKLTKQPDSSVSIPMPEQICVANAAASLTDCILREAHLLSYRVISMEELEKSTETTWEVSDPVRTAINDLTAPHWQSAFRSQAAESDLRKFRDFADSQMKNGAVIPLSSRMALTGRLLEIGIYRHDNDEAQRRLDQYLSETVNNPLRKYQYDLGVWLLRRVDSHGTKELYDTIVRKFSEHAAITMHPDEQLQSVLHISRLNYAPHAFFQWAIAATADPSTIGKSPAVCMSHPKAGMTPQQRVLRATLGASLLPAFRRIQRAADEGRSAYLEYDCEISRTTYPEEELVRLADAAGAEITEAIKLATPEMRQHLKGALHALKLYADPTTVFESFNN